MVRWCFVVLCAVAVAPGIAFAGSIFSDGLGSEGFVPADHPYVDSFDTNLLSSTASFNCTTSSGTIPAFCFESSPALLTAVPIGEDTILLPAGSDFGATAFSADNSFAAENPDRAGMSSDLASVVPEPASIVLMGTGVLAIAGIVRRKRKR
jgi:PEP-CTERM motif